MCPSRKNMYSVMAHSHFGDCTIIRNNKEVIVPQKMITKKGVIKKTAIPVINALFEKAERENLIEIHA